MRVLDTSIPEVKVIEPEVFSDERGLFMETWQHKRFAGHVANVEFVQDNYSHSAEGTLRGIHYQVEKTQGKLVRVVCGEVLDVAVDLRRSSPTFGRWVSVVLSGGNHKQLWVPAGFGHAFLVRSQMAGFEYKCTDYYAPDHERSILWNDPELNIDWQLAPGQKPLLSEKDRSGARLKDADLFP